MKKILLSVVCLMMIGMQSVKAQIGIAALHHAGSVSVFKEDKVANAIAAAVEGDTIYLSEGHFLGNFTIDKPIHVIGSGQGTIIDGNITISIDNNPTLTGYLLTGLYIKGYIIPTKSLNGLRISQCYFTGYGQDRYWSGSRGGDRATITDLYVERCYCTSWFVLNEVESGSIYSCKLGGVSLYGCTGRTTLNHCNIGDDEQINGEGLGYFAVNCIINTSPYSGYSYQNCLINTEGQDWPSTAENCWGDNSSKLDSNLDCTMTVEELQSNNYIGTDGTVVGITGGEAPYTLKLATPKVLEHNIVVDKETKKLNVTLKVGNE